MDQAIAYLLDYLQALMDNPRQARLDLDRLPPNLLTLGQKLQELDRRLTEASAFAENLAMGNLEIALPTTNNRLAFPLKALHASLRHLTWQTQRVARGDYRQRVDFMGAFSQAFNTMTQQLEMQRSGLLIEIEDWQQKNQMLRQNTSMYEKLVGQIEQWIIIADADTGQWLFVSREADEVLDNLQSQEQLHRWMQEQAEAIRAQKGMVLRQVKLPRAQGQGFYSFSVSIHPMYWGQSSAITFVLTDTSTEQEKLEQLQDVAHYDCLTQVYSRYYGTMKLEQWLGRGESFVLCFIDINHLKEVNDRLGHHEGDRYIIRVAQQLKSLGEEVVICRMGGDEFMVLASNWTLNTARAHMRKAQRQLQEAGRQAGASYDSSMGYGFIWVGADNTRTSEELLQEVDQKMYSHKRNYKKKRKAAP